MSFCGKTRHLLYIDTLLVPSIRGVFDSRLSVKEYETDDMLNSCLNLMEILRLSKQQMQIFYQ